MSTPPGPKSKAPKGPPKAKPKGNTPTPPTTPRSQQVKRAADMTAQEKARTPCAFYAYNSCRAKQCAFLHDSQNKYKGPPPKALRFPKEKAKGHRRGRASSCASGLLKREDLLAVGHCRRETFVRQTSLNLEHETARRSLPEPRELHDRGGCPAKR